MHHLPKDDDGGAVGEAEEVAGGGGQRDGGDGQHLFYYFFREGKDEGLGWVGGSMGWLIVESMCSGGGVSGHRVIHSYSCVSSCVPSIHALYIYFHRLNTNRTSAMM